MPDDQVDTPRRHDPAALQKALARATALLDTDQPSDDGYADYDLGLDDETQQFGAGGATVRSSIDTRRPAGVDWGH